MSNDEKSNIYKDDVYRKKYKIITEEWIESKKYYRCLSSALFVEVDGIRYSFDNHYVIHDHDSIEDSVAKLLFFATEKRILLLPSVKNPCNIKTPDFLIDDIKYELASIQGNGKTTIYDAIKNKKNQAKNFIINILSQSNLSEIEVEKQMDNIFCSSHTRHVKTLVILRNDRIVAVYKRK